MAQWTNEDSANGAPIYVVDATTGDSGKDQYGNTVFAYQDNEAVAGAGSPGWVRVVNGSGSLTGITIVDGGTLYANTDALVAGDFTGTITTDANGVITAVSIDFDSQVTEIPEVTVTTETGSGATFNITAEGRIGRKTIETLVAMRGIQEA